MQERRYSGRWQIDAHASVRIPGHAHPFYCTINDINFKGMRLRFSQNTDIDNVLAMSITLGGELFLNIEAAIAWNKMLGSDNVYGLLFTKIKDNDKENIYKFIQRNFSDKISQHVYRDLT